MIMLLIFVGIYWYYEKYVIPQCTLLIVNLDITQNLLQYKIVFILFVCYYELCHCGDGI